MEVEYEKIITFRTEEYDKDKKSYQSIIEELKQNSESLNRSSSESKFMSDGLFKELVLIKNGNSFNIFLEEQS